MLRIQYAIYISKHNIWQYLKSLSSPKLSDQLLVPNCDGQHLPCNPPCDRSKLRSARAPHYLGLVAPATCGLPHGTLCRALVEEFNFGVPQSLGECCWVWVGMPGSCKKQLTQLSQSCFFFFVFSICDDCRWTSTLTESSSFAFFGKCGDVRHGPMPCQDWQLKPLWCEVVTLGLKEIHVQTWHWGGQETIPPIEIKFAVNPATWVDGRAGWFTNLKG